MILGLDISTSAIGICLIDKSGIIKNISFADLKKKKNIFEKAEFFKKEISIISKNFEIDKVVIEENLQAFRPGMSSAKTIVSLARFNGICSYIVSKVFSLEPEFVNVNAARKLVGFKKDRKSSKNTKEQILNHVSNLEPSLEWPTKVLKNGPRRGNVVLLDECYDMADAYIVATSAYLQEKTCLEQKK